MYWSPWKQNSPILHPCGAQKVGLQGLVNLPSQFNPPSLTYVIGLIVGYPLHVYSSLSEATDKEHMSIIPALVLCNYKLSIIILW